MTTQLIRGSGNVFRDLGIGDPDVLQAKSRLAAEIIKILDRDHLTVRQAQRVSGTAAGDFSRIRNARLDRFTVDRLIRILNRLGRQVDFRIEVLPEQPRSPENSSSAGDPDLAHRQVPSRDD